MPLPPRHITAAWPRCTRCGHPVSPRSEICGESHTVCSTLGCTPYVEHPARPAGMATELAAAGTGASRYLVDLASYQAGIDLSAVKAAGFNAVNIKLTQGVWYTNSYGPGWADIARILGMGVCTFHWIDNSASGTVQAGYAYRQLQALGGLDGTAHQVDCEDSARPATWQILSDYVKWWQDKLGRDVAVYTGDWWWQPRGWNGASLTPYLWAAPNNGYLPAYPGDTSSAWTAGYGGWDAYSLLQYAVSPITGAGGGNLSKTAIRSPAVWAALTGGTDVGTLDGIQGVYLYNMWKILEGFRSGRLQVPQNIGTDANGQTSSFDLVPSQALKDLTDAVAALKNQPAGGFTPTPEQINALAQAIVAADNPLTDADLANVRAVIHNELGQLVLRAGGQ